MGAWNFKEKYNINSVTTNQSESVNAMVSRYSGVKGGRMLSLDRAALTMYRLFESFDRIIMRARYRVGENWTLLQILEKKYDLLKDKPILLKPRSQDEIIEYLLTSDIEVKSSVTFFIKDL